MGYRAPIFTFCAVLGLVASCFLFLANVFNQSYVPFIPLPMLSLSDLLKNLSYMEGTYNKIEGSIKSELDFVEKYGSCEGMYSQSSGALSHIRLLNVELQSNTAKVLVTTTDNLKRTKVYGGDVIFLWAEQDQTKTKGTFKRAAGTVEDLNNGSYLGSVQIPWSGPTKIRAKIASKLGNACRRFRAKVKYGNSVFATNTPYGIYFKFTNKQGSESTKCAPLDTVFGYESVCNFTNFNFGLTWSCGKPRKFNLKCLDLHHFGMLAYPGLESKLGHNETDVIHGAITETLTVEVIIDLGLELHQQSSTVLPKCVDLKPAYTWNKAPTGFAVGGHWINLQCESKIDITKRTVLNCLKNKKVILLGDSTIRQYQEALSRILIDKRNTYVNDFTSETHTQTGINITWRKHALPYHNPGIRFNPQDVRSIAHQLRKIANDHTIAAQDIIIGINYNSHLQAFPVSVYRERIRDVLKGIKYLLRQKPGAKILFKGPHHCSDPNKWFDARVVEMYRDILFEEFASVQDSVIYLDVLSITIAFDNEALHPAGDALNAHIYQFLSFICSAK